MEPIEYLSRIVIETLKEFAAEKRVLTQEALCDAFAAKKKILPLLSRTESSNSHSEEENHSPSKKESEHIPLTQAKAPSENNSPYFPQIRDTYLNILAGLGPITREEYRERSSDLLRRIRKCQSLEALVALQDDLVGTVRLLSMRAIEQIDYAGNFLTELSEDLAGMEKQLFTYQDFNREGHLLNGKFHDDLLSHSNEISQAFRSNESFKEMRNLIASKLMSIGMAVEAKRREDEVRFRESDHKIAELQTRVRTYNDQIVQATERAKSLEKEVLFDALTEIHNRRAYELQIRESLRRYHLDGQSFSLVLIDVDEFKNINDNYGHSTGDKCLRELAKLIKSSLRKTDFLCRYGGEELIAILEGASAEDGRKIAEKIRSRIERARFSYQQEELPITISLGVTEVMQTDKDSEAPFSRADNAMYQAKRHGRNRVCVM